MKKIVVGASYPRHFKIGAWLIKWWEETDASHVYVYIKRDSGIHLLYQAVGSGVEFEGYEKFCEINKPIYEKEIVLTNEQFISLVDYCIPKLKTKYSVIHLAGLFIKRFVQYISREKVIIKNPFKDEGKAAVCVEVLCGVLAQLKLIEQCQYKVIDPEDVGMFEAMQILNLMPGKELIK